jgi:tetratricopeptide (TPR) repeat protein
VTADASRVILIGLDGADWRLLTPHLECGLMPNLASVVEQGVSGRIAAPPTPHMDVAWACALTGMHAHDHGVLDAEVPSDDGCAVRPAEAADRRAPVVWEVAQPAGIDCIALGWGSAIGDCGVGDPHSAAAPSLDRCEGADGVASRIDAALDPRDRPLRERLHDLLCESERTAHHAVNLMRSMPWRLAAVRFAAFGAALNDYVRFVEPVPSWVLPRRAAAFRHAIEDVCRLHDQWIGQIIALAAAERSSLVIASPRGTPIDLLKADPSGARSAQAPSRPHGMIALAGPGVHRDSLAFGRAAIDLCPTVLALLGCACPQGVSGRAIVGGDREDGAPAPAPQPRADVAQRHAQIASLAGDARALVVRRDCAFAESLADAGFLVEAADALQRLAEAGLSDGRVHLRRVALLRDAGRVEAARAALDSCSALPDDMLESYAILDASLHAACERHRDALDALEREQRRQHAQGGVNGPWLHVAFARSQRALGMLVDAERSCDHAIELDPECRDAHVERARALFSAERYQDAIESGRHALALAYFDPQTHLLVGTALAALGCPHDAVAQLLIAVEQDPGLVAAYRRLAAVHVRQLGDVTAARTFAARAAEARAATVRKRSAE